MKPTPLDLRREDYPDLDGPRLDKLLRALNTSVGPLVQILGAGALFADNLKAKLREITFTAQDPWAAPSMLNAWVPYGGAWATPAYRLNLDGHCELRGVIKSGALGVPAFILPVGYRPPSTRTFVVASGATSGAGTVDVLATGQVNPTVGSATFQGLDGIRFDAAVGAPVSSNPVFPIRFKNDLGSTPAGVWVWAAADVTDGKTVPVALGPVAWSVSADQVVISDIGNVCSGRKYRVKLAIVAG